MHTPLLKLVQTPPPFFRTPIVRIVNDDLTTLNREEVPNLIFESVLYFVTYPSPPAGALCISELPAIQSDSTYILFGNNQADIGRLPLVPFCGNLLTHRHGF
jgi:hypothetical protein